MPLKDYATALGSRTDTADVECSMAADMSRPPRQASVMVAIYGNTPKVLMTKKAEHLKIHAGEIAFPGGKKDKTDMDLLHTALRESREETGVDIPRDRVVGVLRPVMTLCSNFVIAPFVCILDSLPPVSPNREVDEILEIPIGPLLSTQQDDPENSTVIPRYRFTFNEHVIWGASADMLKQIADKMRGNYRPG